MKELKQIEIRLQSYPDELGLDSNLTIILDDDSDDEDNRDSVESELARELNVAKNSISDLYYILNSYFQLKKEEKEL